MFTWLRIVSVLFFLCLSFLSACSEEKKEKGTVEQVTDKAAKEAVDRIKVPLDQSKTAADLESNRGRQLEEQENKR
jgi:hypothetical protein